MNAVSLLPLGEGLGMRALCELIFRISWFSFSCTKPSTKVQLRSSQEANGYQGVLRKIQKKIINASQAQR